MKAKSIFAATLLVAGAAFADSTTVETDYVLGVMPLTISGYENIINIPWIESGTPGDGVAVSNLVKTAGLENGDALLWYDTANKSFQAWKVLDNQWKATATVGYGITNAVEAGSKVLKRGQALILARGSDAETTIYVIGQDGSGVEKSSVSVVAGDSETPAYTLIAPPSVTNYYINAGMTFTGPVAAGDVIWLSATEVMMYVGSKWIGYTKNNDGSVTSNENPYVRPGEGMWYISKGGNPSIKFN